MNDPVPPWLQTMRDITGTKEVQGAADSPVIMAWRDEIARRYPDMAAYCAGYTHDSIAWCGLTVAYCMAKNGIKPVNEFLWADNWRKFGTKLDKPRLGCILTFKRTGGNHVAFYEGEEGSNYIIRGGNQSDMVCVQRKAKSELTGMVWPGEAATVQPSKPSAATFQSLTAGGYFCSTPFDKSIPASIRTNNPGALNIAPWVKDFPGYVGDKVTSMSGASPNSTVIFSAPEYGVAAWYKLLEKYQAAGATTVGAVINRYGGGQDYAAYARQVVGWSGLAEDEEIDLGDNDQLLAFARAMFRYEAGRETPLSNLQILKGFDIGRGKAVSVPAGEPAPEPTTRTERAAGGILAALAAAAAAAWQFVEDYPVEVAIGVTVFVIAAGLVAHRYVKGHWLWQTSTGDQLPGPSPHLPPSSEGYLDQLSARLEELSVQSPVAPLPEPSASKPRRKRSAKPSRKTPKRRPASKSSKRNTRTHSLRKRKSKSR